MQLYLKTQVFSLADFQPSPAEFDEFVACGQVMLSKLEGVFYVKEKL